MSDVTFTKISLSQPDLRLRLRREDTRFSYRKRNVRLIKDSDLQGIKMPASQADMLKKGSFLKTHTEIYPVDTSSNHNNFSELNNPKSPILQYIEVQSNRNTPKEPIVGINKQKNDGYFNNIRKITLKYGLTIIALLLIGFGSYSTFVGWRANNLVKEQANKLTTMANQLTKLGKIPLTSATSSSSGTSSTVPSGLLSTAKNGAYYNPPFNASPLDPVRIVIPSIGVNSSVSPTGLTSSGALGVPYNVFYTAWYDQSAFPGQQGATLIDGHVSSWTSKGVFYYIKDLKAGDLIKVTNRAGTTFNYSVVKSQVFSANSVNMASAVTPITPGTPGLNLITCTGDVIPGTSLFNERVIVYSSLVS